MHNTIPKMYLIQVQTEFKAEGSHVQAIVVPTMVIIHNMDIHSSEKYVSCIGTKAGTPKSTQYERGGVVHFVCTGAKQ